MIEESHICIDIILIHLLTYTNTRQCLPATIASKPMTYQFFIRACLFVYTMDIFSVISPRFTFQTV